MTSSSGGFFATENDSEAFGRDSKKHPGFCLVSVSLNERIYQNASGGRIIEVLSVPDFDESKRTFSQSVVTVVQGRDFQIYEALQWLDWWRWHPDVGLAAVFAAIAAWVVLASVHLGAVWFAVNAGILRGFWLIASCGILSLVLPIFEISAYSALKEALLKNWGKRKVKRLIAQAVKETGKSREEYRNLLEALAKAHDTDKAGAAQIMLHLI